MLYALLISSIVLAQSAVPSPPPAYTIYKAMLKKLDSLPQPAYIDATQHYQVIQKSSQQGGEQAWYERVVYNSKDRTECVLPLPFTSASPPIIGSSYFAPDVWLVRKPPAAPRLNAYPDRSDLKTIVSVTALASPSYDIRLGGSIRLPGGGDAYHLVLRPRTDPAAHNLRELWVDAQTNNVLKAVVAGSYAPTPSDMVQQTTVTELFGQVGPYWVVIHWNWTYPLPFSSVIDYFEVTAHNMRFPGVMPDWLFSSRDFDRHRAEIPSLFPNELALPDDDST